MNVVYDLRDDHRTIESVQKASLSTEPVGLKVTHGLLGSDEWWQNIREGHLATRLVQGTIIQLWAGREGDLPEVEVVGVDQQRSRWVFQVETSVARTEFKAGNLIEISYVDQAFKTTFHGKPMHPVVLRVRVEAG